ncbi:MAG: OmpA family protein [Bacteroidaceae bacterium]|nr:OmpA family protein [Bacteroidaceae bacterium]MDE6158582.1 OmpA family protein [Bacteroidaceae bacterium]
MFYTKRILAVALMGMAMIGSAKAQKAEYTYKSFPHGFIGVQGGGQTTFTNYDNLKLITPTASIYGGYWFTPVVGGRLHLNGVWNQGGVKDVAKYDYKYLTTNLDLMLNLVTMFGKKDYYPVNVYLLGGIGLNTAWDNGDARKLSSSLNGAWDGTKLSHNARVGAQLDVNLCRNLSLNLEVAANSLRDRYNSKIGTGDDWELTAQLGLTVKFGHKKQKKEVEPEVWETRIDTTWYDDVEYVDVTRDRNIRKDIFFVIDSDSVRGSFDAQLDAVAEFLKGVKNGAITIVGYADVQTGTPKYNMALSEKRALATKKALLDRGVDASMIKSVSWKGDTEQPFAENDQNRVCIIKGHGIYNDKDRKTVKKYRTEQVRYRVK